MAFSNDTEKAIRTVMKQKACTYEEAIAFLIDVVQKQRSVN
ncbi:hypothetical protein [Liquorilactobacillus sucicola]|nr:hypothetical protein [Liquorilactobacillus sucicola]